MNSYCGDATFNEFKFREARELSKERRELSANISLIETEPSYLGGVGVDKKQVDLVAAGNLLKAPRKQIIPR